MKFTSNHDVRWTLPRQIVAGTAAVLASIVWTHGLAAVFRNFGPESAPLSAGFLTLAAITAAVAGCALLPRPRAEAAGFAVGFGAALAMELTQPGSGVAGLALAPVAVIVTRGARWIGGRLPPSVDTVARFRPLLAVLWVVLALAAVIQMGRLTTSMTDRQHGFVLTTEHPFWYQHECIGAYLYGAEMTMNGEENVYLADHYLGLNPNASPQSELEGVALDDPYQYPPQFLLVPRLALAITGDVATLRVVWFALQVSLFAAVAALLALWIGGPSGRSALWLLPGVMISFPALHNFQFGQFHLVTIATAVAAMLLVARGRNVGGGALLAAAILTKIFPVVLLPMLVVQRRYKALAWTAAFCVLFTAVSLVVLGPAPFVAFFDYHLPRLGTGAAFAFDEAWPELTELVVADNQGVFGLARKFGSAKNLAGVLAKGFGFLVLVVAALTGLRRSNVPRNWQAALWLSLLGLASLASPGAWGDYVPVTAVWLLSILAAPMTGSRIGRTAFTTALAFEFFLLGTMPIGDWAPIGLMIPVSAIGALIMIFLFASVAASRPSLMADRCVSHHRDEANDSEELLQAV